jgi:methyl-accepting chemotaxis protein
MDQTTQQNASLVEEAAAASETLQRQASELADAVRVFKLDELPQRRAGAATRTAAPTPTRTALPPMGGARRKAEPVMADGTWEAF